ncbi:hypothetical protein SAMN05216392_0893 [Streptococcus equinus]|uniref:Uncharacterized protein n=2 Tax=Streptococcus equinus TaxID=1335 RepID=A0A1H0YWE5_STREI|nr:hypothetical protein SAMN05216392_0893 [Streptococcus equinus]
MYKMTLDWYYWLLFAVSWLFAITFWIKSTTISPKWLRLTYVICGVIAFLLPFFWGWLVS